MERPRLYVLSNEAWEVGLLPETGMSTAFGRIQHGNGFIDFMRPTPVDAHAVAPDCANYLLIPWSNRIRDARFVFRGVTHQLRVNFPDGTAMHGTAKDFPWEVLVAHPTHLAASFDSRHHSVNFPFPFEARAEFSLQGGAFIHRLSLTNVGDSPMPAGFGHHPYFRRALSGEGDEVHLEIPCHESFELDRCLPSQAAEPVPMRLDFRAMRPLGGEHFDDALTKRTPEAAVRFRYPKSKVAITLEADPLFEHIILYAPTGQSYFAVEPITHVNDGFNLFERGVAGSGVFVLDPGETRSASFSLVLEP